ncbi:hypothetical protein CAOG_03707 [Capsaspora owczarzaki ATCC 30864]|uniref:SNARE-complex protein Syntaxin-18 N-terminal domain-containing protein n=1 Tax=Capsaspora owczarzaki (strain ATCC 30864) TaxID=595528 RepID=A0A0D2VQA9_CAPO3|nr:hypothetical protein CAOG_03707 [Capsaspora owczarzaki ATCC 30864]KJE92807.1 hypothetical protein CAOG_003707 [Capsaspora owczarzaki ATCC 30864]|eukprot:XP_004363435.2 hypothetical protein CAOG_03707 [Capsaspora owczarzaki ATCC 30864]
MVAADHTLAFRDAVRKARSLDAAVAAAIAESSTSEPHSSTVAAASSSSRATGTDDASNNSDPFAASARQIASHLASLQQFVQEHRHDYLNATRQTGGEQRLLSSEALEQLDSDAMAFVKQCTQMIASAEALVQSPFQRGSVKQEASQQLIAHRTAVVNLLTTRLQAQGKEVMRQRDIRVKRSLQQRETMRLDGGRANASATLTASSGGRSKSPAQARSAAGKSHTLQSASLPIEDTLHHAESDGDDPSFAMLSPEELMELEQDNERVFTELHVLSDQTRLAETRMVEIAQLQAQFASHVMEQAALADSIHDLAVHTTANVAQGNEQLTSASKHLGSFRLWILFFLLLCSFCLLFLDWYS